MTWRCGDCESHWPDAVPTCIGCLSRQIARYDRLVTAAIDPEAQFQTVADVRAFLQAGLPECRQ
jgi:hypothetical protein